MTIGDVHFLSYFHCHWIGERALKAAKVIELVLRELEVYRERGQRSLSARIYESKCSSCMWGCRMPVEIIVNNWNPRGLRKYRFETVCYGPLSPYLFKTLLSSSYRPPCISSYHPQTLDYPLISSERPP